MFSKYIVLQISNKKYKNSRSMVPYKTDKN